MKHLKLSIIMMIIMLSIQIPALAMPDTEKECADILYSIDLFKGVGINTDGTPDYALGTKATRGQAVTMLVRLLGREDEAMSGSWTMPFTDVPTWAEPYVGYAYANNLTNGTSSSTFSTNAEITEQQYLTFLLRALGYDDQLGDFSYTTALQTGQAKGLLPASGPATSFDRGAMVMDSYRALCTKLKGSEQTLSYKLLWDDTIDVEKGRDVKDGTLLLAMDMPDLIWSAKADSLSEVEGLIRLSIRNNMINIRIEAPGFSAEQLQSVYDRIISGYHWKEILGPSATCTNGYIVTNVMNSDYLMLQNYYEDPIRFTKNYKIYYYEQMIAEYPSLDDPHSLKPYVQKVDSIVNATTNANMSDAEKVKALHDYLCNNTTYDSSYEGGAYMTPHFAYQVIFDGHGVCDGYSEAFKILCNGAGIECRVIYGSVSGGLHAWNQVKINGQWYNVDITWDDTQYRNRISYNYFCKSDDAFIDHVAEAGCKVETCPKSLA